MRLLLWLSATLFLVAARHPLEGQTPTGSPRQLWLYCSKNLWVDQNIDDLENLWQRAAEAGYTHVLLADSKFSKLGDMDARYFRNIQRLRETARRLHLEIVPALFSIGYSNDLLWHDPNLIEGLPVRGALFVVSNGVARLQPDPLITLKGADCRDLSRWDWKDDTVRSDGDYALIQDPQGRNARVVQKLKLQPFRQYYLSLNIRTRAFQGTPEIKLLAGSRSLTYNVLGVKPTQEATVHHLTFNSLEATEANLYIGCWDGRSGSWWFNNLTLEEVGLVNLIRRPGAPLLVRTEAGTALAEGRDFAPLRDPRMGNRPWNGSYGLWHEPPLLHTSQPDGTRLRVSYYHAATVHEDQAMICPSEPRTLELLRDQAKRMHEAWSARGYMMSHDEIRILNWCEACQRRQLSAGALLADHVRACIRVLREVNPEGRIYVWSDMFDPHHNAHDNYYLVRGDLAGSWEGLDPGVIIVPWYFEKRRESLAWFAGRGHHQVIAGYYDAEPARVADWLSAAASFTGVEGVMYTTWQNRYEDLAPFARSARGQSR